MMLMVPASKVSVPLEVVMRTWSRVPPRACDPLVIYSPTPVELPTLPEQTQVVPVCRVKTILL